MKIAALDVETTQLNATYGRLICACFKFVDEKEVRTYSIKSVKEEPKLLEWIQEQYDDADIILSWYGKGFDIKMINGRLMHHGFFPLDLKKHIDLYYQAKKLKFLSGKLDNISKDLNFENRKYDVEASHWVRAAEGDTKSIKEIVTHCEVDVRMTEEAYKILSPLISKITK